MAERTLLVAAQLSSLFSPAQATSVSLTTTRQNTPLPQFNDAQVLPEHATHSSVIHTPITGTILLRVLHGGLILELVSLSSDISPIRFVFPSSILPAPAIFLWDSHQLHVIAVTVTGSLYRLVIDIGENMQLWRNHVETISFREYLIKNYSGTLDGLVHVQGTHCVVIGQPNGSLLRLDAEYLGEDTDEWTESIFYQQGSFLSTITSLLTSHTTEGSTIISVATHPWPTDIGHVWSLSRDRILRFWKPKLGCVATKALSWGTGKDNTPTATTSLPSLLLGPEPRTLLRIFSFPEDENHLYILVFLPSFMSGVFHIIDTYSDHLQEVGVVNCATSSSDCQLQDFMIIGTDLYVLWERQGQSKVERLTLDLDTVRDEDLTASAWQSCSYAPEAELTPAYLEEVLLSPGSMTERFFEVIMRPGVFSALTLRTALDQYTDACLSLPGTPPPALKKTYSTLGENISAVVGCTVTLNADPKTGALQHSKYRIALKRDWEGFIARCREIERSARWPLVLGARDQGDIIVVERERVGAMVDQDLPISLWRSVNQPHPVISPAFELLGILWALRAELSSHTILDLENRLVDVMHQEIAFPFVDILRDQSDRVHLREELTESVLTWMDARLEAITDLDGAVHTILDAVGGVEPVIKTEAEDEVLLQPQTTSDWLRALTAAYVVTSANARYDLCLSLMSLFYFLPNLSGWKEAALAEVFAVFRGVATLRFVAKQPASISNKPTLNEGPAADDVVTLMQNMHMTHSASSSRPTISLIHLLLVKSGENVYQLPAAAFRFLDNTGLLQSISPAAATGHEVAFCEKLRAQGYYDVAREILSWLPRTPAVTYVMARLWLNIGRGDDATFLLEKIAGSFGPERALSPENQDAMARVLPNGELFDDAYAFYLHAAMLFKYHSLTYQEVTFTQLAISSSPADVDTASLWSVVVKGYTDLGMYEDAYASWVASPHEHQKRESLSHLIYHMSEDDAVAQLISFNFAGFVDDVEECLAFKARNMDPRIQPNYARILYSWYTMRGDYRNASLAMYQRAKKLHELLSNNSALVQPLAEETLEAYMLAKNSLALVDPNNAWILIPGGVHVHNQKKQRLTTTIPENKYTAGKYDPELVRSVDIEHKYLLLSAQFELIQTEPSLLSSAEFLLPATSIVLRLALSNRFDYALTTARSLSVDMSDLFAHLTTQCLQISRDGNISQDDAPWLLRDTLSSWSGTPADRGWRYLRQALEQYDSSETDYNYTKVVFETILSFQRSPPPPWLVRSLEENHHEYLIRSALRYEYLEQALQYTLSLVRKVDADLTRDPPKTALATWLPYMLVDQVLAVSTSCEGKTGVLELRAAVSSRIKRIQQLSNHLSARG